MVIVRNVEKRFGPVHAVRGVSFSLDAGQVVGLLGHNGAGKSTTMRMIAGFLTPDAGSVQIAGFDTILDRRQAALRVGYMPESTPLYPEMRAREYLAYRAKLYGLPRRGRAQRIDELVTRCWIRDVANRAIAGLSKGYKQRVGLAAALLHDPQVILLDEPTSGLDPSQVRETRQLIRDLGATRTLLVSSHILPEVEAVCDRVIIITGGEVKADGTIAELAARVTSATLTLETRRTSANNDALLGEQLRRIVGVRSVSSIVQGEPPAAWTRWTIVADASTIESVRDAISEVVQRAGCAVRELRREGTSLESVFMRAVAHSDQPVGAAS